VFEPAAPPAAPDGTARTQARAYTGAQTNRQARTQARTEARTDTRQRGTSAHTTDRQLRPVVAAPNPTPAPPKVKCKPATTPKPKPKPVAKPKPVGKPKPVAYCTATMTATPGCTPTVPLTMAPHIPASQQRVPGDTLVQAVTTHPAANVATATPSAHSLAFTGAPISLLMSASGLLLGLGVAMVRVSGRLRARRNRA